MSRSFPTSGHLLLTFSPRPLGNFVLATLRHSSTPTQSYQCQCFYITSVVKDGVPFLVADSRLGGYASYGPSRSVFFLLTTIRRGAAWDPRMLSRQSDILFSRNFIRVLLNHSISASSKKVPYLYMCDLETDTWTFGKLCSHCF